MPRRTFPIFAALFLCLAPSHGVAQNLKSPVSTAPTAPATPLISLDAVAGDLHAVALNLERQCHFKFLVRDSAKPYHPVYVHQEDTLLPSALRTIAQSAEAEVSRNMDGVYVFRTVGVPNADPSPPAPKPRVPINPADLRVYRIPLAHTTADSILKRMHWDRHGLQADTALPYGVVAVSAPPGNDALQVQATPDGYEQIRQIVKILDVARFEWTMQVHAWRAAVPPDEAARLAFVRVDVPRRAANLRRGVADEGTWERVEVASGPAVSRLLATLITAHRTEFTPVRYVAERTQRWLVAGFALNDVRLLSDNSSRVTLERGEYEPAQDVPAYGPKGPPDICPALTFHSGDVVALRSSSEDRQHILFLRVDY